MASSLANRLQVNLTSTLTNVIGLAGGTAQIAENWLNETVNGTAANQADRVYSLKEQSIASAGTLTIDLQAALLDAFGQAFTPVKLRAIMIRSKSTNTTDLTLFGDAAHVLILNTAATTTSLKPGGIFLKTDLSTAGIPVVATTADIIKIVNAAGAIALVDIVIIGTSV